MKALKRMTMIMGMVSLLIGCGGGGSSGSDTQDPASTGITGLISCLTTDPSVAYVASYGDDANPGDCDNPLASIQTAISLADGVVVDKVYVSFGVYFESIKLVSGVSVYGGYSPGFDLHDANIFETVIVASSPTIEKPGAVNAINLSGASSGSVTFDGFTIFGFDSSIAGQASYGIYLSDSDTTVQVTGNVIHAGNGRDGADGEVGLPGNSGSPGQNGTAALDLTVVHGLALGACTPLYNSSGGMGGLSTYNGIDASGGSGGERTCPVFDDITLETSLPVLSESGASGMNGGAVGGIAGRDVYQQAFSCDGYEIFDDLSGNSWPVEATASTDGDNGSHGLGGTVSLSSEGSIINGLWVPNASNFGQSGSHGGGGGGGGSGAGAAIHDSCISKGWQGDNMGGTGGGGGAGGQGGAGGIPGIGGGASIGILVTFSSSPTTLPTITANEIYGGQGGDGGHGGYGGLGGKGGIGGPGGSGSSFRQNPLNPVYPAFSGGYGGKGGDGGHGGGGGGGTGGPVYGIYLSNPGILDASGWLTQNTFSDQGIAGTGGIGGYSIFNSGLNGIDGITSNGNF